MSYQENLERGLKADGTFMNALRDTHSPYNFTRMTSRGPDGRVVEELRNPTLRERASDIIRNVADPVTRPSTALKYGKMGYETGEGFLAGFLGSKVVDALDDGRSKKLDFGDQTISTIENAGATTTIAQAFKGIRSAAQTGIETSGTASATDYLGSAAAGAAEGFMPAAVGITAGLAAGKLAQAGVDYIGTNIIEGITGENKLTKKQADYLDVGSTVTSGAVAGAVGTASSVGAASLAGAEVGSALGPGGILLGAGIGAAAGGVIEIVKHAKDIGNFFKHLF